MLNMPFIIDNNKTVMMAEYPEHSDKSIFSGSAYIVIAVYCIYVNGIFIK